jgi:hypothetical protein
VTRRSVDLNKRRHQRRVVHAVEHRSEQRPHRHRRNDHRSLRTILCGRVLLGCRRLCGRPTRRGPALLSTCQCRQQAGDEQGAGG